MVRTCAADVGITYTEGLQSEQYLAYYELVIFEPYMEDASFVYFDALMITPDDDSATNIYIELVLQFHDLYGAVGL